MGMLILGTGIAINYGMPDSPYNLNPKLYLGFGVPKPRQCATPDAWLPQNHALCIFTIYSTGLDLKTIVFLGNMIQQEVRFVVMGRDFVLRGGNS